MAHAVELRNFPEDEKDYAASRPRASVQPFPTTGLPLSYASDPLENLTENEDLEGSAYDVSLYGEPRLTPRSIKGKAIAALSSAIEACTPYTQAAIAKIKTAGKRVNAMKEDRPLQLIGAIAGTAFALGMVTRFWRSRS